MIRRIVPAAAFVLLLALVPIALVDAACADEADLRKELSGLVKRGDHQGLLRAAEAALATSPESIPAMEHRAFALQKLGRSDDAERAYGAVLKKQPDHAWALTQLGWLISDRGRTVEAAKLLRKAIEIQPESVDPRRKLVTVFRAEGNFDEARAELAAVREAGLDHAWAWREEAELAWMDGDLDAAHSAVQEAGRAGAPGLDRLRELIAFDRSLVAQSGDPLALRAQITSGNVWEYEAGEVAVRSTAGPHLPPDVVRLLTELPPRFSELVGQPRGRAPAKLVVQVSRTTEQHEVFRRRLFPQGSRGRAFTTSGAAMGGGRRGFGGSIVVYVAWTASDIEQSLAHEFAHAAIRQTTSGVPVWLDEGVATYLENVRGADDDPEPWRDELRAELTRALRNDRALSWTAMIAAQRQDFEGPRGRERYAQAWSMVRFLLHSDEMGADAAVRRERLRSILRPGGGRRDGDRGGFRVPGGRALIAATYAKSVSEIDALWRTSIGAPKRD